MPAPQEKTYGGHQRVSVVERFTKCRLYSLSLRYDISAFACPVTGDKDWSPIAGPDRRHLRPGLYIPGQHGRQSIELEGVERKQHNKSLE